MNVSVKLDLEKLVFDKSGSVHMMTTLVAPDVSKDAKRNPLCICAVIDRSGSMGGEKMQHVKHSMWKMIDNMTEDDSLAIVFFDDRIETAVFRKMNSANKEVMKQEVAKVYARGSTDLGSALMAASRMFSSHEGSARAVERIMLLTDGQANIGATCMQHFAPIVAEVRNGVTVSTFGYGDAFNEELLTGISKHGKGNSYFIENPDNVAKVFAVELGGLLTCFAQDIVLSIKTHKGTSVTNVLNDMDVSTRQDDDGELVTDVKIGDIYAGERRDVMVRLEFEKRPQVIPRPVTLADVSVKYRTMSDAQSVQDDAKVKVSLVKTAAEATKEPDKDISEQVAILDAANVMAKAKKMADDGDWAGAKSVISSSSSTLRRMKMAKASHFADGMDSFANELNVSYSSGSTTSKGMGSYAYSASTRGMGSIGNSAAGFSPAPVINCVMSAMVDDFESGKDKPDAPLTGSGGTTTPPPSTGYTKTRLSQ